MDIDGHGFSIFGGSDHGQHGLDLEGVHRVVKH